MLNIVFSGTESIKHYNKLFFINELSNKYCNNNKTSRNRSSDRVCYNKDFFISRFNYARTLDHC